jgi:hypothetical protein
MYNEGIKHSYMPLRHKRRRIMEEQAPKQERVTPEPPRQTEPKPSAVPQPPVSGPFAQFEAWLHEMLVVKAPYQLPKNAKDWIVKYWPWIILVLGILLALTVVPGLMAAIAFTGYTATYGGLYGAAMMGSVIGPMFYLALAVLAVQLVVMFISVPMLLKRQRKGWQLVFYSSIISLVYTVFNSFSYGVLNFGGLIMGLISAAIGLYFIFQIRGYYTK